MAMNWYFEKSDLIETPSSKDGIKTEIEQKYRRQGAKFLIDCGNSLGLKYDTLATGAVFFHRFFMHHSFNQFPRFLMAASCLFLAGKVEETPKKCKDIIKTAKLYLESKNLTKYSEQFDEDPIKEMMTYEKILLQTIKFDLQVEHPYMYLLRYAKSFQGNAEVIKSIVQSSWTFINDSYCTTLCLQWEPEIIAIAFIYLASKLSQIDLSLFMVNKESKNWFDQFVEGLKIEVLEDICHQILDLYVIRKMNPEF